MTAPAFSLDRFEYLRASTESTLLRLSGRWQAGAQPPETHVLIAHARGGEVCLTPLPQPPRRPGEGWSAAYSAPLHLVKPGEARFALEVPGLERLALPRPRERTIAAVEPPPRRSDPAPDPVERRARERATEGERRRTEHVWAVLREQLASGLTERLALIQRIESEETARAELSEHLARERAAADAARHSEAVARRREDEAKDALAQVQVELARAQSEALDHAELERRTAELAAAASAAESAAEEARVREDEAVQSLAAGRAELESLRRVADSRRIALKKASRRISTLRGRLETALSARVEVDERSYRATAAAVDLAASLDSELAQAHADARAVRDDAARQIEEVWATLHAERERSAEFERAWQSSAEESAAAHERVETLTAVNHRLHDGIADGERRLAEIGELAATFREALAAASPGRPRFARDTGALRRELDESAERLAALETQAQRLRVAVHAQAGAPDP